MFDLEVKIAYVIRVKVVDAIIRLRDHLSGNHPVYSCRPDEPCGLESIMTSKNPNPIDVHVGNRVRMRRMLIGMSQERLGKELGLTFQQVQKYEKGTNRISASRLYRIAQILGVPVQYFFEDLPQSVAGPAPAEGMAEARDHTMIMDFLNSSEGLQLNRHFAAIKDPNVRRAVVELVRNLARADEEN